MLEPILWRPFGWCRLEADIAGRQKKKGENRAQARQLRAVLPVGSHEEAARLLARLIADAADRAAPGAARRPLQEPAPVPQPLVGPQRHVRRDDERTAHPHHRLDAARRSCRACVGCRARPSGGSVSPPIRLDTAGRNIRAAIRDRKTAEADQALNEIVRLSRIARRA